MKFLVTLQQSVIETYVKEFYAPDEATARAMAEQDTENGVEHWEHTDSDVDHEWITVKGIEP